MTGSIKGYEAPDSCHVLTIISHRTPSACHKTLHCMVLVTGCLISLRRRGSNNSFKVLRMTPPFRDLRLAQLIPFEEDQKSWLHPFKAVRDSEHGTTQ